MYLPEYTITPKILKNIADIEYSRAIIDNTTILSLWQSRLLSEALTQKVYSLLELEGYNLNKDETKKVVDTYAGIKPTIQTQPLINVIDSLKKLDVIARNNYFEDQDLKSLNKELTKQVLPPNKQGTFRSKETAKGTDVESILARVNELIDWIHSMDARNTHPVIISGIVKIELEQINAFENFNKTTAGLISYLVLKTLNYSFEDYLCLETYFLNSKVEYMHLLHANRPNEDNDLTDWLTYFSEGFAMETSKLKEKMQLVARDAKLAKATGTVNLTPRQEKIVEYIQDYGLLKNSDFPLLFPDISEDTVLRDLKKLVELDILVKLGRTKSSRYELK
ncbi:MAG: hypothetical protein R3B92_01410 [Patescibacteria group bacterium]|uniref:Fido domain-containing protein n=1 Tax=candidate division WWE3 bacterium TaxID=2053526 RepID=A0A955J2W6_UNCKA|nr:hypothetical protein [candidate division WWE3 bacterium]